MGYRAKVDRIQLFAHRDAAPSACSFAGSGAFAGSDLDFILKRLGIDTLIYAGVVTNACVMLSVASGFDLGYRQYLATDCTGALCDEDQADAERLMGFYLAQLVTTDDTITALDRLRTAPRSPGE